MWNELEHEIDRRFKEYFDNKDYSAEAKKQLADYAIEEIRKLLHPKNGQVYYKDYPLGEIYIGNKEIKEWINDYLDKNEKEKLQKPFHDYLYEIVMQAAAREWEWTQRQNNNAADVNIRKKRWVYDYKKITEAANFYASEYLKERIRYIEEGQDIQWTANAQLAWAFASKLITTDGGKYYYYYFSRRGNKIYLKTLIFNPSVFGQQQARNKDGTTQSSFSYERIKGFLEGYENDEGSFCGSYLNKCVNNYFKDTLRLSKKDIPISLSIKIKNFKRSKTKKKYHIVWEKNPNGLPNLEFSQRLRRFKFKRVRNNISIISVDKPIGRDNENGNTLVGMIPTQKNQGDIESVKVQFVNLTKYLCDFQRICSYLNSNNDNDRIIKWTRCIVFYIRDFLDDICYIEWADFIRSIEKDIDIIFKIHYRVMKIKDRVTKEKVILDYRDFMISQVYIYYAMQKMKLKKAKSNLNTKFRFKCKCNRIIYRKIKPENEEETITAMKNVKPAYVNAFDLYNKCRKNTRNEYRYTRLGYLNTYFKASNLSKPYNDYESLKLMLWKEKKLEQSNNERDAFLDWIQTYGRSYDIFELDDIFARYDGKVLNLRYGIKYGVGQIYLEEKREQGDRLVLTTFSVKPINTNELMDSLGKAYRIAVYFYDNLYGKEENILRASNEYDYCRLKCDMIIKKLKERQH